MSGEQILNNVVQEVFSPIYQAVVGVSILYFLYGVVRFMVDLTNPEKKAEGKSHLLFGMIGLFIILSVGAIIAFLGELTGGMFK